MVFVIEETLVQSTRLALSRHVADHQQTHPTDRLFTGGERNYLEATHTLWGIPVAGRHMEPSLLCLPSNPFGKHHHRGFLAVFIVNCSGVWIHRPSSGIAVVADYWLGDSGCCLEFGYLQTEWLLDNGALPPC